MNVSQRIYRLLLRLYPREHRRQYGQLMATHFDDQLREARGGAALLRLWLHTVVDIVRSAPREHADTAWGQHVTPWPIVLLAVLPGALPFLFMWKPQLPVTNILLLLATVYGVLFLLCFKRKRPIAWIFAMMGMVGAYSVMALLFIVLSERVMYGQILAVAIIGGALGLAPAWIKHGGRWTAIFGAATVTSMAAGFAWHGTQGIWLHGEGLEVVGIMLPVVAMGALLARRYGVLSGLVVAGSAYWAIELSIDSSLLIRFGSWSHVLGLGIFVLIISIIPLLTLRARSTASRTWMLVTPLAIMLLVLVVLPPLVYMAYTGAGANASEMLHQLVGRVIDAMQILTVLAFALSLYSDSTRVGEIDPLLQRRNPAQFNEAP